MTCASTVYNIPGDCSLKSTGTAPCIVDCTTTTEDKSGITWTSGQVTGPVPTACSVITDDLMGWPIIGCPPETVSQTGIKCDVVSADGMYAGVYVTVACAPSKSCYDTSTVIYTDMTASL